MAAQKHPSSRRRAAAPAKARARTRRLMLVLTALGIGTLAWVLQGWLHSPSWNGDGLPLQTVCCDMSNSEALGLTWTPFLILAALAAAGVLTWWKGGRDDPWVAVQMSLGLVAALLAPFALMTLLALACIDTFC